MIDFTPIARKLLEHRVRAAAEWIGNTERVQTKQFNWLLGKGRQALVGERYGLASVTDYEQFKQRVPVSDYADIRTDVMRMVLGEPDLLWPGVCRRFAQSSGTSDGKSKYIPVTDDALKINHYGGGRDVVAHYLASNPDSRLFSGKSFILGGSFANELEDVPRGVTVGDLSANLIDNINPIVNLFRVPPKKIALMPDWSMKLPALVDSSIHANITSISGVPSWFMTVIREVMKKTGVSSIHDVWPNLEVFFHGGISFVPYRKQYESFTDSSKMHFMETYNASEGFFACQSSLEERAMLLLLDIGVFYEFIPMSSLGDPYPESYAAWQVEPGRTYALAITSCNGLWRYLIGDTVKIHSVDPLKITIAGRTKHFINAFGEEVMVYNTDAALAHACAETGASALNYTAAPVFAEGGHRGRHQWLIEWQTPPSDIEEFAEILDHALCDINSDYQAKRAGNIFLDRLTITTVPTGFFDRWLAQRGGKLGGQRKVPRLSNDRKTIDSMLALLENN